MVFLCDLYEGQAACGRYFVHELTSEVESRMKCVTRIMAMPGTKTLVADLCMFGLAACDEGGPEFVNASVRKATNTRRVGKRMQNKCTGTHRHARVGANNTSENMEHTGTWVHHFARAMEEHLRVDEQELKTREKKKKAKKIRGFAHENDKDKGTSHVQNEIRELMHATQLAGTALLLGRAALGWQQRRMT